MVPIQDGPSSQPPRILALEDVPLSIGHIIVLDHRSRGPLNRPRISLVALPTAWALPTTCMNALFHLRGLPWRTRTLHALALRALQIQRLDSTYHTLTLTPFQPQTDLTTPPPSLPPSQTTSPAHCLTPSLLSLTRLSPTPSSDHQHLPTPPSRPLSFKRKSKLYDVPSLACEFLLVRTKGVIFCVDGTVFTLHN